MIGARAQARDGVGAEGVGRVEGEGRLVGQDRFQRVDAQSPELQELPNPVGGLGLIRLLPRRRIEYLFIPFLGLLELPVGVQVVGDEAREVEEHLPQIKPAGPIEGKAVGAFPEGAQLREVV